MTDINQDTGEEKSYISKPKKVAWERIWAFSGGPFALEGWPKKNIHTDIEYARACGLPDNKVAVSATQFQGYLVQLMIELFGVQWLSGGTLDVKFIRIVNAGDTITSKAVFHGKEIREDTSIITLDVWCENQDGEVVLIGTATANVEGTVTDVLQVYNSRLTEIKVICSQLAQPGDVSPEPLEYLVTPELNHQFLHAEEDYTQCYIEGIDDCDPVVHPALLLNWSNDTRSPSYKAASLQSDKEIWATIHTRDETFFINPARVGKKIKVTWRPVGIYEKRGRPYSVSEILVVDEDGMEILRRIYYTTKASLEYRLQD